METALVLEVVEDAENRNLAEQYLEGLSVRRMKAEWKTHCAGHSVMASKT
jgi:hypothetical protein